MDPNVPFADTSARRAELMEATEKYKSSIESNVESLKGQASEVGKTAALVAGVCVAVFVVASIVLPNFGDDEDDDDEKDSAPAGSTRAHAARAAKAAEDAPKKSAIGGAITGILTSIVTNIARQQVNDFVSRLRQNNAASQPAATGQYSQPATYNPRNL